MARLGSTDRKHVARSVRLLRQLARELDDAEASVACRRAFDVHMRAAETAGRLAANEDALNADRFDPDVQLFDDLAMAFDVEKESNVEFHAACLREVTPRG